jgi:hypothetical protein
MTILTGLMMVLTAHSEIVCALRPAIREAAARHGVDPVLMEAIIRHESANATSSAARNKNNLAGIMGRRGQRRYESKEACINHLAEIIGNHRAKGRVTLIQLSRVYCESHSSWVRGVSYYMNSIRNGKWGNKES